MITGVQDVYVNVSDLDRSIRFFSEGLGLEIADPNPYFAAFDIGGVRVGLHPTGGARVGGVQADSHGANGGATITLRTDDLDADRARLEAAGAEILGASDNPWGRIVVFTDPDGNVFKLMGSS